MTTTEQPIEAYLRKIERHLLKKYPALQFDTEQEGPESATIHFLTNEKDDWYAVIERAGPVATDALVDAGLWIHVQPRFQET